MFDRDGDHSVSATRDLDIDSHADDTVDGTRVEIARSDHGSSVLLDGLNENGAYVHETVLYRLVPPEGSGEGADAAASGDLNAALDALD